MSELSGVDYVAGGERAAFDEGVHRGEDYLAIVRWANYEQKSAVYVTAPFRTEALIEEVMKEGKGYIQEIYDLHLDRDSQLNSPFRQMNTEVGLASSGTYYTQRQLQELEIPPRPREFSARPNDPVEILSASFQRIDAKALADSMSAAATYLESAQRTLETIRAQHPAFAHGYPEHFPLQSNRDPWIPGSGRVAVDPMAFENLRTEHPGLDDETLRARLIVGQSREGLPESTPPTRGSSPTIYPAPEDGPAQETQRGIER
ncbi:hypothetical protein ACIQXM_17880 [Arthrobacter sp. NPDC097144]|uniref:hypothetical protein n=1 Tax=Arthrobacter sp. NPDC097144 TaxID=3363946 RepID=UPI0038156205